MEVAISERSEKPKRRLQQLIDERKAVEENGPNSEEAEAWFAEASALLNAIDQELGRDFDQYRQFVGQPLSSHTLVPLWSNMIGLLRRAVAQLELQEESTVSESALDPQFRRALQELRDIHDEFNGYVNEARSGGRIGLFIERVRRWKKRTDKWLKENVGERAAANFRKIASRPRDMGPTIDHVIEGHLLFLRGLEEEALSHPEHVFGGPGRSLESPGRLAPPDSGIVFLVHGHDELNTLRLKHLLREKWGLEAIILANEPQKGRTLIEKFEEEAQRASFAFALMTSDDVVRVNEKEYTQARPNVIFELGWFYGRFGRERVCILFKRGIQIHSDLDGIGRIEFNERIDEKVGDIGDELIAAGLIPPNDNIV